MIVVNDHVSSASPAEYKALEQGVSFASAAAVVSATPHSVLVELPEILLVFGDGQVARMGFLMIGDPLLTRTPRQDHPTIGKPALTRSAKEIDPSIPRIAKQPPSGREIELSPFDGLPAPPRPLGEGEVLIFEILDGSQGRADPPEGTKEKA
jgi:hypothetical protein